MPKNKNKKCSFLDPFSFLFFLMKYVKHYINRMHTDTGMDAK